MHPSHLLLRLVRKERERKHPHPDPLNKRIEKAGNARHKVSMEIVDLIIRHQDNLIPTTGTRSLLIRGRDPKPLERQRIYPSQVSSVLRTPMKLERRKIPKRRIILLQERGGCGHRHRHNRRPNLKEFLRKGVLIQTRWLQFHPPYHP